MIVIILTLLLGCLILIAFLLKCGNVDKEKDENSGSEAVNDKYLQRSSVEQDTRLIVETVNKPRESINIRKYWEPECRSTEENKDTIYGNKREMDVNRTDDDEHLPLNQDIENDNLSDEYLDGSLPIQEKRLNANTIKNRTEGTHSSKDVNPEGRVAEENENKRYDNRREIDVNRLNDDPITSIRENIENKTSTDENLDGSLPVQEQRLNAETVNESKESIHISKDMEPENKATVENDDKKYGNIKVMEVNKSDDEIVPDNQDYIENKNPSENKLIVSLPVQDTKLIAETVNEQSINISKDVEPECRATEENQDKRCGSRRAVELINQETTGKNNPNVAHIDGSSAVHVPHTILCSVTVNEGSINTGKDGEPEGKAVEDRLLKVLKILNLTEKYPGLLSREEMHQITKSSLLDVLPTCHEELASYFIHKITRLNYLARDFCILRNENKQVSTLPTGPRGSYRQKMNKRKEETKRLNVSPMDIIIAVFLCCDDICRQDLVSHMWSCRLSIPLIIQIKMHTFMPSCFLWPLRNLMMKWETQKDGNINVREGRLVKECITSIAFIRVGETGLSKSALINNVISASEKTHSIFFHRDSPGSTKHRYLVDGLIDISWYFPMPKSEGKIDDHFTDAVMFLNLHGDAHQLQSYLPVLSKLANIITVLCKVEDLDRCRQVIQPCLKKGINVLLIFTDKEIRDVDEDTIDMFAENIEVTENQLEYLEVVDKTRSVLVQETRSLLIKLDEGKSVRLEEVCSSDIEVTVDEKADKFLYTKKEAAAMATLLQNTPYSERKDTFLYLQGDPWINWAVADKEKLRITYKKKDEDVQMYMAERVKTMKKCRSQQQEFLNKENTQHLATIFLNAESISNAEKRKLFLRWLKFELDDLSRKDLSPVYEDYHKIMQQITEAKETEKEKFKKDLEELDKEVGLRSFGLEHIMREIGQIYEALHVDQPRHPLLKQNLPKLAANILLDGYPFELFDGYVNAVPIQWVADVLRNLDNILQKKHNRAVSIKVISALGIQSSGKSTMLNALFGCQYAVSAGRCTRGLYCQLIKVEETYSKELGVDYVLAVDTEGLRAPELSASGQMVKHDNELSTFVIGLGDLTILNLMGENTTYLDDFLPISVHAFLRMQMTTDFRPKCTIVHQNVNKEDQQKLLQQGRILEEYLDKTTKMACKVERIGAKSFKDIIQFDVSKDVFYLPGLLEGCKPMAPVSTRYSDELNILKHNLVKETCKQTNTLAFFRNHLRNLWSAIKKDDFVYQFRNTIETEARSKLDEYWCAANWKFRQPIRDVLQKGYIEIQNTQNVNELDGLIKRLQKKVTEDITKESLRQKDALSIFINNADPLTKETMMKWSVDMDKRFDDLRIELLGDILKKLRELEECMRRKFSLKDDKLKYQDTLKENIAHLVKEVKLKKCGNLTKDEISDLFEQNWGGWKSKILKDSPICQTSINIGNDAFYALFRAFPLEVSELQKCIENKSLERYDFDDFKAEAFFTTFQRIKAAISFCRAKLIQDAEDFANCLFRRVKDKLRSRKGFSRPYSQEDIEEVVQNTKNYFSKNKIPTLLENKGEIRLAVIVCGHAIQQLQRIHQEYEKQNNLGNLLENEKMHYHRIFSALSNEAELVNLLGIECQEIIMKGILHKMTLTLPDIIERELRCKPFTLTSKTMAIYDHMINMARDGLYENFKLFIADPHASITQYICTSVDKYAQQKEKPLQKNFVTNLHIIEGDIRHALQKSFPTRRSNFQAWLETFRKETKDVIVLENIDRLQELGKDKTFNLELFFKRVLECLENIKEELTCKISSYLDENYKSVKDEVVRRIMKNIIGCTKGCPFCGAICVVAHAGHDGEHYTTLHRPVGCNRRNFVDTKELSTTTCTEAVTSETLSFAMYENGKWGWCPYKDYKTVYSDWKINGDETGDETSFWNFFFAQYANKIAENDLKVPIIPQSWKELDCKTEIKKLEDKMNK